MVSCQFTVYLEAPFWVGIYERVRNDQLEVCKITFGAEPKDYEVYHFLLANWHRLKFSQAVNASLKQETQINPKRMQRSIKKKLSAEGVGTKSQQALKLQHEENKIMRKQKSRQQKEEEQQYKFQLRQQKKKEKHRGR